MKRSRLIPVLVLALAVTSCSSVKDTAVPSGNGTEVTSEVTEETTEITSSQTTRETAVVTTAETSEEVVFRHEFQPHVYSGVFEETYDEATKESFFSFCDAVLAGDTEFYCPDTETYFTIMYTIAHEAMPLYVFVYPGDPEVEDGVGHISYSLPKDEYLQKVAEFEEIVTGILDETCEEDYDDIDKALALYSYFAYSYTYDYTALDDFDGVHVPSLSAYRLLTTGTGICQEIAPAYTYLLLQAGVDATTCGSLSDTDAHEWSFVKMDGEYYHIDPTFTVGNLHSLAYFGMNDEKRVLEGGFYREYFNYGEANVFDHDGKYAADDDRFAPLWNATISNIDYEDDRIYYYPEGSGERAVFEY